jgi:hypothetical protein
MSTLYAEAVGRYKGCHSPIFLAALLLLPTPLMTALADPLRGRAGWYWKDKPPTLDAVPAPPTSTAHPRLCLLSSLRSRRGCVTRTSKVRWQFSTRDSMVTLSKPCAHQGNDGVFSISVTSSYLFENLADVLKAQQHGKLEEASCFSGVGKLYKSLMAASGRAYLDDECLTLGSRS